MEISPNFFFFLQGFSPHRPKGEGGTRNDSNFGKNSISLQICRYKIACRNGELVRSSPPVLDSKRRTSRAGCGAHALGGMCLVFRICRYEYLMQEATEKNRVLYGWLRTLQLF